MNQSNEKLLKNWKKDKHLPMAWLGLARLVD